MGILVVQHTRDGGPRRLATWLEENGLAVDVVYAPEQPLPQRLTHEAMIVLGGGYLPDEDDRAPWLPRTRALTEEALERGVPFLGICLGGQLLAHVAGGTVEANVTREYGSVRVTIRPEAMTDPLFGGFPASVPAVEHHVDAITALPPGAAWLASSADCAIQALRVGRSAWGTQFHPEITADDIRATWDPPDREQHAAQVAADESLSTPVWRELVDRFADVVRDRRLVTS